MKLIRNTILLFLLLYAGWNVFLAIAKPVTGKGQHQWQQNVIAAQEYADVYQGRPVVITGTSLSFRMYNEMLPKTFYNLSFGGGSVLAGIDIVRRSPKKPKLVLIELNVLYRPYDQAMVNGVFTPGLFRIRPHIPAMREKYQPVTVLQPLLAKGQKMAADPTAQMTLSQKAQILKNSIEEYNVVQDTVTMEKNIVTIKGFIKELEGQGIRCVVYTMPVHCSLLNTMTYHYLLPRLYSAFPKSEYTWLPEAPCGNYDYTDGLHLTYTSAQKFSAWFSGEAMKFYPGRTSSHLLPLKEKGN